MAKLPKGSNQPALAARLKSREWGKHWTALTSAFAHVLAFGPRPKRARYYRRVNQRKFARVRR
jgi:hypothetical protein